MDVFFHRTMEAIFHIFRPSASGNSVFVDQGGIDYCLIPNMLFDLIPSSLIFLNLLLKSIVQSALCSFSQSIFCSGKFCFDFFDFFLSIPRMLKILAERKEP